jgi:hypothetical protein
MGRKAIAPGPIAFVIALAAAVFMLAGGVDFCLDDAWIHLAYAKSLRLGDGLSYNPGDHATGFSSPLWVLLVAVVPWGANPLLSVKLIGALCHATTAWGAASLTEAVLVERGATSTRLQATAAGLICALDPALTFAAVSGMEVSLAAALLVWSVRASLGGRNVACALLSACAVWARPESLFFLGMWSVLRYESVRKRRAIVPLVAAGGAMLIWIAYCMSVSGYPFPNTYYAKRDAKLARGLVYIARQYLPNHAWFVGVAGVALLGLALSRAGEQRRLVLAWLTAIIAIAGSREIFPNVLFYCWRYFAPLAAFPCVALACALPDRRAFAAYALAPIALASMWMLPNARALQRAQENDILLSHTQPAAWAAATLPPDARLLVEGAGATRFTLPRTARVIDVAGLNLAAVVHAPDSRARVCAALRLKPTHALLPDDFFRAFAPVLDLEPLRQFVDPNYRIAATPRVERVLAARVIQIKPAVRQFCGIPP